MHNSCRINSVDEGTPFNGYAKCEVLICKYFPPLTTFSQITHPNSAIPLRIVMPFVT